MFKNLFLVSGLLFNLIGSIVVAYSVKENPFNANQLVSGKKIPLASIYLGRFRKGITFLIIGFILQFVSVLFK